MKHCQMQTNDAFERICCAMVFGGDCKLNESPNFLVNFYEKIFLPSIWYLKPFHYGTNEMEKC